MAREDDAWSGDRLRRIARAGGAAERVVRRIAKPVSSLGFPYRAPTTPKSVDLPERPSKLGADFETDWARKAPAKAARRVLVRGPLAAAMKLVADPEILGVDRLDDLRRLDEPPPVIFAPNHHSHIDTPLMVTSVPEPWRSKLVIAAAADYFFNRRVKGAFAALALNALPIDREVTGRKSSDMIRGLVEDGWSLVIYPEGGRSPDGWGQEFKGGAAYLSARTGAPVVPVFLDGSGAIFGKGMKRPKPGKVKVIFGAPLWPVEGENTRRFNTRIENAVTMLGDEALTDYWTARQRAATKTSPGLRGPEYTSWRRQWQLSEQRKLGAAGLRRRQKRRWPSLD